MTSYQSLNFMSISYHFAFRTSLLLHVNSVFFVRVIIMPFIFNENIIINSERILPVGVMIFQRGEVGH